MFHWIWVLIVGGVIGLIAGAITRRGGSMGVISNIIAGLVGSSLGEAVLGAWGATSCWNGNRPFDYRCSNSGINRFLDYGDD